jgi:hypothetical protein
MDEMTIVDPKGRPKYRLTADSHRIECLHPARFPEKEVKEK